MKNNIHHFNVGDDVWYTGFWEGIQKAKIVEIEKDVAKCKCYDHGGSSWRKISELYNTKNACLAAAKEKSNRIKDQYRREINSVEDLVIFMLNHDVSSCEYQDYEARAVAIEKAKELLSLDCG